MAELQQAMDVATIAFNHTRPPVPRDQQHPVRELGVLTELAKAELQHRERTLR